MLALMLGLGLGISIFLTPLRAQQPFTKLRVLLILDCSYSMYSNWGQETRMDIAKRKISQFIDSVSKLPNIELGLRCYGHTTLYKPDRNCEDTRLEIPFGKGIETANPIKKRIKSLEPMGTTPIAYSIGQAAYDFPKADDYRNLILLITDGLEECQGNPCYISQELQNKGIITKPYIIGLNVPLQDQAQLGCIGRYFNADAPDAFLPAMYAAFSDMAFATTAQVFLLDEQQQPTESDVLMTFTDEQGYERYNWIHSLNALGTPDTLILNPLYNYSIRIHTLPPVISKKNSIITGRHNIIPIAVPQGSLQLDISGAPIWFTPSAVIHVAGQSDFVNVQAFQSSVKYLKGLYDVEILTLPRLYAKGVTIESRKIKHLEIPASGAITFVKAKPGSFTLFVVEQTMPRWIHTLKNEEGEELVFLLPGTYRMVYQFQNQNRIEGSKTIDFTVQSGIQKRIQIN